MKIKKFLHNRLWKNNASVVQLLGLCPVLAMTTNAVNAIGLGITTTFVLIVTNTIISLFKRVIPKEIRIPIYMLLVSSIVTSIEMFIHAYQFNLYRSLGVFIPLIVTNCIVVGRADFIAYKNSIFLSFFDGLFIGLGITLSMFIISLIREILGHGTLFFGLHKIIPYIDHSFFIKILEKDFTMLLFALPPGGFFVLGFLIAFKNFIDTNNKNKVISCQVLCSCLKKNIKIRK
ncbi:electron transport complex subunit E [Buchnera aphidicola (Hyadaphis tataricae)]|uniref:Ion-translocating oxidoreductase complex subunit E n=1 Tax=Buchnera aphidicola (Hyadaphis tataricae) TaxID=1241859 RepID=A0A4D6YAN6_9GAMM|nr:electron transport complex subunit E [Buchnera aphidicola]QCI21435.1 electron transport complex subunit E [Buchnera aphidicola (Hyadaphis tataricae)]